MRCCRVLKAFFEDHSVKNKLRKSLYQLIHKKGVVSKVDFIDEINVPNTTLTRMISELENKGLIRMCGYGESSGGRPPTLYEVVPNTGFIAGIEISRTHVYITLQNIKFELIDQYRFSLTKEHTPNVTIDKITYHINKLLDKHSLPKDLLIGIGIGAVGPLNREKGIIVKPEAFLAEGWIDVPIVSMLQSVFPVPITLNNGANTAALAEYEHLHLQEEDLLYSISGYGIRCGFINRGGFLNNREGDASSYGHIIIEPNGKLCTCGKRGCLNAYVTFQAIFESIKQMVKNDNTITPIKIQSVEELINHLNNNDGVVKKAVLMSAYYYGIAIANMINILNPNNIILHGQLIDESSDYYREVVRVAREHTYKTGNNEVLITKGGLGEKATVIGAAMEVLHSLFD